MPWVVKMQDRFAKYHPLVNFLYFTLVIGFSMALNHPLAQGISLICAAAVLPCRPRAELLRSFVSNGVCL